MSRYNVSTLYVVNPKDCRNGTQQMAVTVATMENKPFCNLEKNELVICPTWSTYSLHILHIFINTMQFCLFIYFILQAYAEEIKDIFSLVCPTSRTASKKRANKKSQAIDVLSISIENPSAKIPVILNLARFCVHLRLKNNLWPHIHIHWYSVGMQISHNFSLRHFNKSIVRTLHLCKLFLH